MKPLGTGFEVLNIGKETKLIRSVPKELNCDSSALLAYVSSVGARGQSIRQLCQALKWTEGRCNSILQEMMREGQCWIDEMEEKEKQILYWFPVLCHI